MLFHLSRRRRIFGAGTCVKVILSIDPIKYPMTGIGRYTFELVKYLSQTPAVEELRFFRGGRFSNAISPEIHTPTTANMLRRHLLKSQLAVSIHRWVTRRVKSRVLQKFDNYIFHGPNFYLPPFGGPSVVTIHDISVYTWPHCHPSERVRYMQREIEFSLKHAAMLITVSEFTRREVVRHFNWPEDKVVAVPLASADEFRPRTAQELSRSLNSYNLDLGGYCLFAGTIEPRKNIAALLDAYETLSQAVRQRWPLILVGYKGWNSEALHARMAKAERAGWARYLGFVPAADLPLLFAGARLFVFPSLYEGFGLPVLEAMASGVPVVCSNSSSLPEVGASAAAYCEASDFDALRELIARGLEDEAWRASAREKGFARARLFSWERCARETVAVYQEAQRL